MSGNVLITEIDLYIQIPCHEELESVLDLKEMFERDGREDGERKRRDRESMSV